ncbi:MAG: glycosyltransferase family 2 protein [Crocinitomicaceae bacterium]
MQPLSVVIITFNEARNIERAIKSVINISDDIIIVDSYSTDETKSICQKFNVTFIQRKWEGYSQQKNFANSLAKHSYILSLDADESLDNKLENEIQNLKKNGFKGVYVLNRLVNYCGQWIKHSTWYPDKKIRIFPKDTSQWSGQLVHEELEIDQSLEVIELSGHLHHFTYYNYIEHRERADKYSNLTAIKMHQAGKKASIFKPYLSAFVRFISMFVIHLGFLDGFKGFKIAQISAYSNIYKYKRLRQLNSENKGGEKNSN